MDKSSYEQDKQKYEREIEEILAKYDKEKAQKKSAEGGDNRPVSLGRGYSNPRSTGPSMPNIPGLPKDWRRVSAGQFIAAAFAVALLAVFLRGVSGVLSTLLVIVSVALFFIPILMYRSTGSSSGGWTPNEQKRWRGQVIDLNTRRDITNDPFAAIKRWFRKR